MADDVHVQPTCLDHGSKSMTEAQIAKEQALTRVQLQNSEHDKEEVQKLIGIGATKVELWRYYSDRADRFAEQLWSTGTWLLTITGSILVIPFAGNLVVTDSGMVIQVKERVLTFLLSGVGIFLCIFSYFVLTDIRNHLQRNWDRADLVRTDVWQPSKWAGAKLRSWWVLTVLFSSALVAFVGLAVLACRW